MEFTGQARQEPGGISEIVVYLERVGVVGEPRRIFDVVDLVTKALQPDNVVKVLPDHPGDWARTHEAHHDNSLPLQRVDLFGRQFTRENGRVSGDHAIRRHAFCHHRAGGNDGILADGHPFQNNCVHPDPDVI